MFNSVRFWLRRGVDGFRVDAIDLLMEDPRLPDNPMTNRPREGSATRDSVHTVALHKLVLRRKMVG